MQHGVASGRGATPGLEFGKQALAAIGQPLLMARWRQLFEAHGRHVAQVLLTHADLADRERYLNARSTLLTLLQLQVIPVINENDTVVTDEIKFGDNDTLGALVANLVEADSLVILTDQRGLYSADPRKDRSAKRYDTLTYMDVLSRDLQVMDASAISLARENKIPIIVFDIHKPGAFAETMRGQGTFTIIKDEARR